MARKEKDEVIILTEEDLKAQEKEAQRMLAEVQERKRALLAEKKAEEERQKAIDAEKRKAEQERLAAEWRPICRVSGAYDYDEDRKAWYDTMRTLEIRQNIKTGVVKAFVL